AWVLFIFFFIFFFLSVPECVIVFFCFSGATDVGDDVRNSAFKAVKICNIMIYIYVSIISNK
uniref:Uncharacterized protein n=1 Tax=Oryza brachyantha TaxID=4533 RepID=J3L143_ORYBR